MTDRITERITIPFSSEHFVAFCLAMLEQPYWYGSCVRLEVA